MKKEENENKIKENFSLAFRNHEDKNYTVAENFYKKVLELDTNHFATIYLLGSLSVRNNNYSQAKTDEANTFYNLGVVNTELGDFTKAITYYEKALSLRTNHANTYNNLGLVLSKLGDYKKAISFYEKAIKLEVNHANAYNNLGLAFKNLNDLNNAKNYYEKALSLEPNEKKFNSNYGELLLSLNHHKKGLEHIKIGSGFINFTQENFEII